MYRYQQAPTIDFVHTTILHTQTGLLKTPKQIEQQILNIT